MKKFILLCSLVGMSAFAQKIDDFKRIEVNGFFTNPLFSPTGKHVLLTGEHLKGVYLLDLKDNTVITITDKAGSGYGYSWDTTGESFFYKEKPDGGFFSQSAVINYNIGAKSNNKVAIDHNYLPSYKGEKDENVVVYTNLNTLQIEAMDLSNSKRWVVTKNNGQFYNAILSNDGKKVAVHNGADIFVYPIDGSTGGNKIGTGIATAWTQDDMHLIGFLDESEDGHTITNSEIYLFNAESGKTKKLTNTEVISEMFPTIHEDKVIYTDDKTGRIFIATIK